MQPVDGQLGVGKVTTPDLFGPLKGLGIINLKDQVDNGGLIYIVILTKDHPQGEMRGQLISAEAPPLAGSEDFLMDSPFAPTDTSCGSCMALVYGLGCLCLCALGFMCARHTLV